MKLLALNVESLYGGVMATAKSNNSPKVSSYQKLKEKLKETEKKLYWAQVDLADGHLECDKLDVPRNENACIGHRLFWYSEGKRESFKTRDNPDGYPPEVHDQMVRDLEAIRTPPSAATEKKSFRHKLNIIGDEL